MDTVEMRPVCVSQRLRLPSVSPMMTRWPHAAIAVATPSDVLLMRPQLGRFGFVSVTCACMRPTRGWAGGAITQGNMIRMLDDAMGRCMQGHMRFTDASSFLQHGGGPEGRHTSGAAWKMEIECQNRTHACVRAHTLRPLTASTPTRPSLSANARHSSGASEMSGGCPASAPASVPAAA